MGLLDVFKKRKAPKFDFEVEDNNSFVLKLIGNVPRVAVDLSLRELAAKGIKYKKARSIKLGKDVSEKLGESGFFKNYFNSVLNDVKTQSSDLPGLKFVSWRLVSCVFKSSGSGYDCVFVLEGNVEGV